MRVAVIDVGSNTIRLLVADVAGFDMEIVEEGRVWGQLGVEVARTGEISLDRMRVATEAVEAFAADARRFGCARLEVLVASPGRQAANSAELVRALESAARARVHVLGREEEARLGYLGALAGAGELRGAIGVCDVGGGSTQLAVGPPDGEPTWLRSLDVGSLRLTTAALRGDPPGKKAIEAARELVGEHFDGFVSPLPSEALAIGGSARGVRRLVGRILGESELREAIALLRKHPTHVITTDFGVPGTRARTLLGGAIILSEVQRRLMVPLRVVGTGLREGAVLELAESRAVA